MRRGERTRMSCMSLRQVGKTKKNKSFKNIREIGAHIKPNGVDVRKLLSTFQVIKRLYGNMLAVDQLRQNWKYNDDE